MALSKPLANGLPIGVTAVSERVAQAIPPGSHGSTFAGNPLCCAAGIATLEIAARPEFQEQVRRTGSLLMESLCSLGHPLIREVRGRGLMVAVELKRNASPVLQAMQRDGVLAIPAGSTNVRFLPPLIVAADQVRLAVETLARALESVVQETSR
jgi:acetylornithine/succinyldiaminopimelate/putrescine aminotransferase